MNTNPYEWPGELFPQYSPNEEGPWRDGTFLVHRRWEKPKTRQHSETNGKSADPGA